MTAPNKKQKMDLSEIATQAWEHFRNYLDSLDQEMNDPEGDIDELQELIELASPHVPKPSDQDRKWKSVVDMLPCLLSVANCLLAEGAIAQFLMQPVSMAEEKELIAHRAQQLLTESLQWYPQNAATWSMGANFGRASHRLSLASTRTWYERAVASASHVRHQALEMLEDDTITDKSLKEWLELLILNQVVGVEFEVDDEEEINTNQDEIEEEDQEESVAGHYSASAVESTSRFMCAMLWSIQGDHDKAMTHLQKFALTHRIHPNAWALSAVPANKEEPTKPPLVFRPESGILPDNLYQNMKETFAPDAAYWAESNYSGRGYYSYFVDYEKDQRPRNLLEEVIVHHLLPRVQQVLGEEEGSKVCGFEWWAHTRPIQANLGHNLHFDTDEALLAQQGDVTHPVLSSILYLTGGGEKDSPGGTTIVFDQSPDSETLAEHCWQGCPKDNSFLLFPGNLLHGVLPCPGNLDEAGDASTSKSQDELMRDWQEPPSPDSIVNRLTVLVGFWTRNVPKSMKERRLYGPCGPLPPATEEHSWVQRITEGYSDSSETQYSPVAREPVTPQALPQVSPAWETISSNPVGPGDVIPLTIPHAIDHRFFVKGAPQCFRDSLFEDGEGDDE